MPALRQWSGFTLVELLIVVLILSILAALVIPAFGGPSLAAREAALMQNLTTLRTAIEIYKLQHQGCYPTGNDNDVVDQLTKQTDIDGNAGVDYGPYLRTGIPRNPFNGLNNLKVVKLPSPSNDSSGWYYDKDTGEIRANTAGTGPSGTDYRDL